MSTEADTNPLLLLRELLDLPAPDLHALLSSDDFGSDTEDSVLLLLASWMSYNYHETDGPLRKWLCHTVRLAHLSRSYQSMVLMPLAADHERDPDAAAGWFPLLVLEAELVRAPPEERPDMLASLLPAQRHRDLWFWQALAVRPRRQCIPPEGLSYRWHVHPAYIENLVGLRKGRALHMTGVWHLGSCRCVCRGFDWILAVEYVGGERVAGVSLRCRVPEGLQMPGSSITGLLDGGCDCVVPFDARLSVHTWQRRDDRAGNRSSLFSSRGEDRSILFSSRDAMRYFDLNMRGMGDPALLPLREKEVEPGNQQQAGCGCDSDGCCGDSDGSSSDDDGGSGPLAAWVDYIRDGTISGNLTVLPPS
ncbi:hypothetical protein PLESTF_001011200 [Pleodorina starrii]|nr:hypothetical protein PLESTM_001086500 [Pleodorina starrii]GLC70584.1 hypothetical protein PLESTF_001011200 [Pleodorina starrii]